MTYLAETGGRLLDGDPALVVDGGPDADGLSGHVASPVQPYPAMDGAGCQAREAQLVLDLAVERLLSKGIEGVRLVDRRREGREGFGAMGQGGEGKRQEVEGGKW